MDLRGIELICPICRGELHRPDEKEIVCRGCARRFRVTMGIPDLRVAPDPYIGFDEEYAKVEKLAAAFNDYDFESFVDFYYRNTGVVPPHHAAMYKRSLLAGQARARGWLLMWEEAAGTAMKMDLEGRALLDVGCGTGPLLVAASKHSPRAGVDIALRWLLVARKRLQAAGVDVPLICACAEALPFKPASFDVVALDSAIEHFQDQPRALDQALRVLRPGGCLFAATPNRFSIGPDPQTGIPAGSLLPEKWTAAIVTRQGGIPPKRALLTASSLRERLERAGFREVRVYLPGIPEGQRALCSPLLRAAIAGYELARAMPVLRWILRWIGPLLHATARRREERKSQPSVAGALRV
jgi:ubiquinone/menaquinone biosynthesis C-methylase UbiE